MGRILCIDPGTKRIGVAISDPSQMVAFAKPVVENTPEGLAAITQDYADAELVLMGKPLVEGKHSQSENLANFFRGIGFRVEYVNEDFSTVKAEENMKEAGHDSGVDSYAAQVVLAEYLAQ